MKSQNTNLLVRGRALALTLATLLGVIGSAHAAGRNPNPGVLPPDAKFAGMTYGEWGGAWWRWAVSFPVDPAQNPVMDTDGSLCHLGDMGNIWFLAGNFGGVSVRECTIPAGKTLLFPILNTFWVNIPELGDNPWSEEQRAFARQFIAPFIDNAFNLSCSIDGVGVQNLGDYRFQTPDDAEYLVTMPENNVFGIAPGTYGPTIDDGIYLIVAPLPPGSHTIHITSASAGSVLGPFSLDVTYQLTVK